MLARMSAGSCAGISEKAWFPGSSIPHSVAAANGLYAAEQALYRSDDNGQSWRRLSCGLILTGVAFTPTRARSTYRRRTAKGKLSMRAVFIGRATTVVLGTLIALPENSDAAVNVVAADPRDAKKIYIGTEAGGLLRSDDGGRHWFFMAMASAPAGSRVRS